MVPSLSCWSSELKTWFAVLVSRMFQWHMNAVIKSGWNTLTITQQVWARPCGPWTTLMWLAHANCYWLPPSVCRNSSWSQTTQSKTSAVLPLPGSTTSASRSQQLPSRATTTTGVQNGKVPQGRGGLLPSGSSLAHQIQKKISPAIST